MKRLLVSCLTALVALAPVAALADTITIGNYSHHTIKYQIRCSDGDDSWHTFTMKDREQKITAANDWNYDCDSDRYQICVGTNNDDDDTTWSTVDAKIGRQYLIGLSTTDQFLVLDTRIVVGLVNTTNQKLDFSYKCVAGAEWEKTHYIRANDFTWFENAHCTRYEVTIAVKNNDGSVTSQTRTVYPDNVYAVKWNEGREVYDFEKLH